LYIIILLYIIIYYLFINDEFIVKQADFLVK